MARFRSWFTLLPTVAWVGWAGPIFFSGQATAQAGDSLEIQNVAERVGDNEWKWTAFVRGPAEEIAKIKCVRYTLHPTFPDPVQEVCGTSDVKHPFALNASGWGTFNLRARIFFKDGSWSDLTHYLKF